MSAGEVNGAETQLNAIKQTSMLLATLEKGNNQPGRRQTPVQNANHLKTKTSTFTQSLTARLKPTAATCFQTAPPADDNSQRLSSSYKRPAH